MLCLNDKSIVKALFQFRVNIKKTDSNVKFILHMHNRRYFVFTVGSAPTNFLFCRAWIWKELLQERSDLYDIDIGGIIILIQAEHEGSVSLY